MSYEEFKQALKAFLREEGIEEAFEKNFMNPEANMFVDEFGDLENYLSSLWEGTESAPFNAIMGAFSWNKTPEGAGFWVEIHHKWVERWEELLNQEKEE